MYIYKRIDDDMYDDFYNNSSCHAMNVLTTTTGSTTNQKAFSLHQNSFTTTVYIYVANKNILILFILLCIKTHILILNLVFTTIICILKY